MADHPDVELVRGVYEALSGGELDRVGRLFAEDVVWHVGGESQLSGDHNGREQVLRFLAKLVEGSGGSLRLDLHDVVGNDRHVVALGTASGQAPDGETLEWRFVHVFHVEAGEAKEVWGFEENAADADAFLSKLPS